MNEQIIDLIKQERVRQDHQWGGPQHDDKHYFPDWITYFDAQVRKANEELRMGADIKHRLIKIAALAIAGYESMERKAEEMKNRRKVMVDNV
jgi:hypothetical protein